MACQVQFGPVPTGAVRSKSIPVASRVGMLSFNSRRHSVSSSATVFLGISSTMILRPLVVIPAGGQQGKILFSAAQTVNCVWGGSWLAQPFAQKFDRYKHGDNDRAQHGWRADFLPG